MQALATPHDTTSESIRGRASIVRRSSLNAGHSTAVDDVATGPSACTPRMPLAGLSTHAVVAGDHVCQHTRQGVIQIGVTRGLDEACFVFGDVRLFGFSGRPPVGCYPIGIARLHTMSEMVATRVFARARTQSAWPT